MFVPRNLQRSDLRFTDPRKKKQSIDHSSVSQLTERSGVRWDSLPWKFFDGFVGYECKGLWGLNSLYWRWVIPPLLGNPYTLGPQNHKKWRFWTPNMGYKPKNEGNVGSHGNGYINPETQPLRPQLNGRVPQLPRRYLSTVFNVSFSTAVLWALEVFWWEFLVGWKFFQGKTLVFLFDLLIMGVYWKSIRSTCAWNSELKVVRVSIFSSL